MHLWPSQKLRDSFNYAYVKKLDWNLRLMKREEKAKRNKEKLLNEEGNEKVPPESSSHNLAGPVCIWREILFIFSFCCCFCCGAWGGDEEDN